MMLAMGILPATLVGAADFCRPLLAVNARWIIFPFPLPQEIAALNRLKEEKP